VQLWNGVLHRIPVVNSIYSSVKQISDTLFSSSGQAFRKALLVQWPHEGMWTIAFQTGRRARPRQSRPGRLPERVRADDAEPHRRLFRRRRRKDVIELDMTVDQALKYIISMGVVPPLENNR